MMPGTPSTRLALSGRGRVTGGLLVGALVVLAIGCCHCQVGAEPPGKGSREAKTFFYSAGAFAVGGTIADIQGRAPAEPLLVQAATMLAPSGGKGVGRIEKGFQYGRLEKGDAPWVISVGSARTEVTGSQDRDCYITTVTNTITDLNVLGRIEAAQLVMEAESRHCLHGGQRDTRFHVTKATFDGLKIDGVRLQPELARSFGAGRTFSDLVAEQKAGHMRGRREQVVTRGVAATSEAAQEPEPFGGLSSDRRLLLTSIFSPVGEDQIEDLQRANKHREAGAYRLLADNGIHVPDLGNVYFGRCLINQDKRETVLLHLELGSPVRGPIDIGGEFGNGVGYP
jgi:hypothetical protein